MPLVCLKTHTIIFRNGSEYWEDLSSAYPIAASALVENTEAPFRMWKRGAFPTQRRPVQRELTNSTMEEIDSWFAESDITIGDAADTSERRDLAKRLFYTWRDCFARTCFDLKATDMIRVRGYGAEDLTTITRARAYCVG